ncbi:hypothetical protein NPX13_g5109 [Xylaria arbuscula]|uniref:Rhodopsin domain-containing protein n=1 Tax=Xylaria arbuscula TaxID=114810 RepID=A0A9W8NF59_9PEZI|nr:hypothetical protein NPX13_g5109 [Xylaria arbuscula]
MGGLFRRRGNVRRDNRRKLRHRRKREPRQHAERAAIRLPSAAMAKHELGAQQDGDISVSPAPCRQEPNLAGRVGCADYCRPLEKLWKPDIDGYCWSLSIQQSIGYFQGAIDVATQLFITLFPIMVIQDLDIPRNVRWPFYVLSVTSVIVAMFGALRTYNISLIQLDERQTFDIIKTILAVLEQNLNIVSANILPIVSLFSQNIRLISEALNDTSQTHLGERDTTSVLSKRSERSRAERRRSQGSSDNVVVESGSSQRPSTADSISSAHEAVIAEAWPLRIIKTVSVEIVEEDAPGAGQGSDKEDSRSGSRQQNWDSYLQK